MVGLRDLRPDDVGLYERLRCDPVMMAELGGPQPREGLEQKVAADAEAVRTGESWASVIVPEELGAQAVGWVGIWAHVEDGESMEEIGWMVLPEWQRRGYAGAAVRALLDRARREGRWQVVHAFPGVTNVASNAVCRASGFTRLEEREVDFAGRTLRANHWRIDLGEPPAG